MKVILIILALVGLLACGGDSAGPAAPSMKNVDSAVNAAPDTIKAITPDSVRR